MEFVVEQEVQCPHCGEWFPTVVDTSQGDHETVEDCAVCCRPMRLIVECAGGEVAGVTVERG
jgi:hypothetical protein